MLQASYDTEHESAILRTMSYFDIFNYPLKASEILNFLPVSSSKEEVEQTLLKMSMVTQRGDLYSLQFHSSIFDRRLKGNALADALLPEITKKANLIFQFPFVRSVMASGSFSKNFMDEKSDFDFFIVCAPKRIWISRMLLVLYKKLFLRNSHQHFCVNYFIDESNLTIEEKNIFTATELATVLPLTGQQYYLRLLSANAHWLFNTFPNFQSRQTSIAEKTGNTFKKLIERSIDLFFGDILNRWFKKISVKRWKKTYQHQYSTSDFNIAFKSTDSVSKNHPRNFQKKIVDEFDSRVSSLSKKLEVYD